MMQSVSSINYDVPLNLFTKIIMSKCTSDSNIYFSDIFNVKLTDFWTALNAEKS